mgnify:FL=1|tara:strand:- start:311 stop:595 length:285 start_codon:yes stop_codon:yes gene_type:complete
MRELDAVRAVFSDPLVPDLDLLYDAINLSRDQYPESDFQQAYNQVMSHGGSPALAWISFTVKTATRFALDHQPEPDVFLQVLEEFCDQRRVLKA